MNDLINLLNQAITCHQSGRILEAINLYLRILPMQSDNDELLFTIGTAYCQVGQLEEGLNYLRKSSRINPKNFHAFSNMGKLLTDLSRFDEAIINYNKAILLNPNFPEALLGRGNALAETKRYEEALQDYKKVLELVPDLSIAHLNRGKVLFDLCKFDEAINSYDQAIFLAPNLAEAYCNRGNVFKEVEQYEEALLDYNKAIQVNSNLEGAYTNRGCVFEKLKQYEAALADHNKAIVLKPNYAEAYSNRGIVLHKLKRLEEAIADHNKAIVLKPDYAEAYSNRGIVLQELKRLEEAVADYNKAILLKPDYAEAYCNRGVVLQELNRLEEAIADHNRAIVLKHDYAEAYCNRGVVLQKLKRWDAAFADYEKAFSLKPKIAYLHGTKLHAQMHLCNWTQFESQLSDLVDKIGKTEKVSDPFPLLALVDLPETHKIASEVYTYDKFSALKKFSYSSTFCENSKIKVGYYSADFHDHATMHLMAELFEKHNKDRFEFTAFSFGPVTNDPWQLRAKNVFNNFIECHRLSDPEVAETSRNLGIDIAVDLKGFTQGARTGIFAARAAPIQVNFIGYPGTMGANYIDYLIGDEALIPEQCQQLYTEKIAYMPDCYQPNCRSRVISNKPFSRSYFGLPENSVVFSSFNNNYKITPEIFASWMRILKAVEGSVLWLLATNSTAENNLRQHALENGVAPDRIVIAQPLPIEEHLKRICLADLILDTFPYGAHTTCSDALRMGVPVVTLQGRSFASRVSASLLRTVGLPELAADSHLSYENLAIALANSPEKLSGLRARLTDNIKSSPLFDSDLFARNLQSLFLTMYQRHQEGHSPDHIFVI